MGFLSNAWNAVKNTASSVGSAIAGAGKQAWQNLTTGPTAPVTAPLANAAATAGNLIGDTLKLFEPSTKTVLPANQPYGPTISGGLTALSPTQLSQGATAFGMTDAKGNPVANASTARSNITSKNIPAPYNPPSTNIGGMSFAPAAPNAPAGTGGSTASSVPRYSGPVGPQPGTGYGYTSSGSSYILPTATSGTQGSGSTIPGAGGGNTAPNTAASGSAGGGTSAFLGAGSAIQGGSTTGTATTGSNDNNKKNTQTVRQPQARIDLQPFQNPEDIGLTKTTTPGGGTAYTDQYGNTYVGDGANALKLVTQLPASAGPAWTVNGQSYALTPQPNIQTNMGQGRVYSLTDSTGNTTYFVQDQQGFHPVIGANLGNGASSGQLTGQLGAADPNIGIPAAQNGMVNVGPQAQNGSQTTAPSTTTQTSTDANLPQFNAGDTSSTTNAGDISSQLTSTAQDAANGTITADQFNQRLQTLMSQLTSAMTSQSGIDPSQTYNIDPNMVANGDQNILSAINGNMAQFNAINQQFGVPQLQQSYLSAISTVGGINAAVSRLTQEILSDPNMPSGMAQNQIQYLANKANELLSPYQAQADTIKAQLSYATSNMRAYYSNYWNSQRLNLSYSNLGMRQLSLALSNNGINPNDPNTLNAWSQTTGIPPDQIALMAQFKTASNLASLTNTQATAQGNSIMANLLSNPNTIPSLINGVKSGVLTPDEVTNGLGRTAMGAALRSLFVTAASEGGVNLAGASGAYGYATTSSNQRQAAAISNVQNMIPELLKLSQNAPRSVGAINQYLLPAGTMIGDSNYSNFRTAATTFADELSLALGIGNATDLAKEMSMDITNPNLTPQQFSSAMQDVVIPFVQARLKTMSAPAAQYAPVLTGGAGGSGNASSGGGNGDATTGASSGSGDSAWASLGL